MSHDDFDEAWRRRMGELERELTRGMCTLKGPMDAAIVAVIRVRAQLTAAVTAIDALAHPTDPLHANHRQISIVGRAVLDDTRSVV